MKLQTRSLVTDATLVIRFARTMRVLSSAPWGGGLRSTRFILNHQVEANPARSLSSKEMSAGRAVSHRDPSTTLRLIASRLGIKEPCVGLMTAVPMTQLVTGREKAKGLWVECLATVGVTNAVRAGDSFTSRHRHSRPQNVGTINIVLVTNATLSMSALVGAVQVITESKTGVLRDYAVPCWAGRPGATGTGTDAVVIVCPMRGGRRLRYSGTHTEIGTMIGRVVAGCVRKRLKRAKRWSARLCERS